MARQRNRRIHFQSGFFGSFEAPWSERSWIDLSSKETQNPRSDSLGFKNPIFDFLKETHPKIKACFVLWKESPLSQFKKKKKNEHERQVGHKLL